MPNALGTQIAKLAHGAHLCLVYETFQEQMAAIVPFVEQGLARREACIYLAQDRTIDAVREGLTAGGIAVAAEEAGGALAFISKRESCLRSDRIAPREMIGFLKDAVAKAARDGYTGFRVAVEMDPALVQECGCGSLIEYEALLNELFPGSRALVICQYDKARFKPEIIHDVLRTHPFAILGSEVCDNLFYETPEMILTARPTSEKVDWMIERLQRFRATGLALQEANQSLRRTEEFKNRMIAASQDCIKVLDLDGRIQFMSEGGQRSLGIQDPGSILGASWIDFFEGEDRQTAYAALATGRFGGVGHFVGFCATKSGQPKWWDSIVSPILGPDGEPEKLLVVSRDVTRQREGENALREAVRARDEFLSIASHELKTPITSLKLQVQMQQRRYERNDPVLMERVNIERWLDISSRQVERLSKLVDDMLDVSRIAHGKLQIEPKPFELGALVRELVDRFADQLNAAGCRYRVTTEGKVVGPWDRYRIEQVVTNLITNAIKYGSKRPVEISVSSEGGVARVAVRDNGIGIAPENQERIFNRFERAISAQNISGLGLGLYISSQIVAAHEGRILVESAMGKGSTFTVELPLRAEVVSA